MYVVCVLALCGPSISIASMRKCCPLDYTTLRHSLSIILVQTLIVLVAQVVCEICFLACTLAAIVYIPSVNQTPQSLADHTLTPYQPHIAWHCPKSRPQSTIECHCVWAECRVDYDDGNVTFCLKRVCVCVCGVAMGCLSLLSNSSRSMLFEQAISVQVFSICCG